VRVLAIDEALPYPPDSGKRIRTWELLRRLAPEFEITLVHPARGDDVPGADAAVRAAGIRTIPVPLARIRKSGPRFAWDLFRNLFHSRPYMAMAHASAAVRRAVAAEAAARPPDLVHVEWTPLVVNVPEGLGPVSIAAHNVESDIWERTTAAQRSAARRWYAGVQAKKVSRFERAALAGADAVLAVSDGDAARIREFAAPPRVVVVRNGVDARAFAPDPSVRREAEEVLFVGSLDWRPNQDAVGWFLAEVWPRIRAKRPAASFVVVGRTPPPWFTAAVTAAPGARVAASVPDVRPFVARAAVSVVPLRIGGGSRLKICEALAMETPVVSTTVGAEGLEIGDGAAIADGAEAFAAAVLSTLADPAESLARSRRGRTRVLSAHDWDAIAPAMAAAWRETAAAGRRR
jgi:glycosyltransferase involved in cell wall biosynthesis